MLLHHIVAAQMYDYNISHYLCWCYLLTYLSIKDKSLLFEVYSVLIVYTE